MALFPAQVMNFSRGFAMPPKMEQENQCYPFTLIKKIHTAEAMFKIQLIIRKFRPKHSLRKSVSVYQRLTFCASCIVTKKGKI